MFESSTPDGLAPINTVALTVFISTIGGLSMLWGIANVFVLLKMMPEAQSSQKMSRVIELSRKILRGAVEITKFNLIIGFAATIMYFLLIMGTIEYFQSFYYSLAYLFGSLNSIFIAVISVTISCLVKPKIINLARFSLFDAYDAAKRAAIFNTYFPIGQTILIMGIFTVTYQQSHEQKIKDQYEILKIAKSLVSFSFGSATIAIGARIVNSIYAKGSDYAVQTLQIYQDRLRKDYKHPALLAKSLAQIVNKQLCSVLDYIAYMTAVVSVGMYAASYNVVGTDQQGQIIFDFAINNCYLPVLSFIFALFFNMLFNAIFSFIIRPSSGDGIRTVLTVQRFATTILLCGFQALAAYLCLPAQFYLKQFGQQYIRKPYHAYLSILFGMLVSVVITFAAQLFVTHPFFLNPISNSCKTGSATNIIYGLSFGYFFNVIPIIFIAGTLFLSDYWIGVYGIGLAAVGFISLLPHYLYGQLLYSSLQNASFISFLTEIDESVTQGLVDGARTKKDFDPQINFYIYGLLSYLGIEMVVVFINSAQYTEITSLKSPTIFLGLLLGAMFPYFYNSCLIRSILKTGPALIFDIKIQIQQIPAMANGNMDPDFIRSNGFFLFQCILSLKRFVPVLLGPIIVGIAGGPSVMTGFICGTVISGIQIGLSSGVSGCAWTGLKKEIGYNNIRDDQGNPIRPDSDWSRAANVGNSIGSTLKDCLSPAIPIMLVYWGLQNFMLGKMYSNIHS